MSICHKTIGYATGARKVTSSPSSLAGMKGMGTVHAATPLADFVDIMPSAGDANGMLVKKPCNCASMRSFYRNNCV